MVKHKWWNGSLTDNIIMAAVSSTTKKTANELAVEIEVNERYLRRRLKTLVEDGEIVRCIDIRRDARAYVYLRKPAVVTTETAAEATS